MAFRVPAALAILILRLGLMTQSPNPEVPGTARLGSSPKCEECNRRTLKFNERTNVWYCTSCGRRQSQGDR
jgi:ribosomal protein L37AE/L43A